MEYSPETHDLYTCIAKKSLVSVNNKAIKRQYNRSLIPEMVAALPDLRFVVIETEEVAIGD